MDKQKIVENNKLIIEFMGYVFYDDEGQYYNIEEGYFLADEDLLFHESWDCLMPVVEKCAILNNEEGFNPFYNLCELDIEAVYKEVIAFITLRNATKKYKIWAVVEEITDDSEYKDIDDTTVSLGEFDTLEEAIKHLNEIDLIF